MKTLRERRGRIHLGGFFHPTGNHVAAWLHPLPGVSRSNPAEAYNFGLRALPPHDERYARAREFVEVCRGLWDSWDDDAFVRDRSSALYFDPRKLHYLRHEGRFFSVRGPLNVARPPQGYPVLANAGVSDTGKEFAADIAEKAGQVLPAKEYTQIAAAFGAIVGTILAALMGDWLGRRVTYCLLCLTSLGSALVVFQLNHEYGYAFLAAATLAGMTPSSAPRRSWSRAWYSASRTRR